MRTRLVVATGVIIITLGIIFHLQGQSVVGPESSFMYDNPRWRTYGIQIALAGVIVAVTGIVISVIKD